MRSLPRARSHTDVSAETPRHRSAARAEVLIDTTLWISHYGGSAALHGFDMSAAKLGVGHIDLLLLLHQPLTCRFNLTLDPYRALEKLLADGHVRAIGVSSFMPEHLTRLLAGPRSSGRAFHGASAA